MKSVNIQLKIATKRDKNKFSHDKAVYNVRNNEIRKKSHVQHSLDIFFFFNIYLNKIQIKFLKKVLNIFLKIKKTFSIHSSKHTLDYM